MNIGRIHRQRETETNISQLTMNLTDLLHVPWTHKVFSTPTLTTVDTDTMKLTVHSIIYYYIISQLVPQAVAVSPYSWLMTHYGWLVCRNSNTVNSKFIKETQQTCAKRRNTNVFRTVLKELTDSIKHTSTESWFQAVGPATMNGLWAYTMMTTNHDHDGN